MKLFVWNDTYSFALIFAYAESIECARQLILNTCTDTIGVNMVTKILAHNDPTVYDNEPTAHLIFKEAY